MDKVDAKTWVKITVLVAVIGCLGTLGGAFIGILPDIIESTSIATQAPSSTIALSENFDNGTGGYDTSLWDCDNECSIENLGVNNGVLNLQRNHEGWSSLVSRDIWSSRDLAWVEGDMKIDNKSNLSVGVLGLSWNSANGALAQASCDINNGNGSPFIMCYFGTQNNREFITKNFSINTNTWYNVKIVFEKETYAIKYYIDDNVLGEYSANTFAEMVKVQMGIYSQNGVTNGVMYFDNVKLALNQ